MRVKHAVRYEEVKSLQRLYQFETHLITIESIKDLTGALSRAVIKTVMIRNVKFEFIPTSI